MSEILDYEKIVLGETEDYFLQMICVFPNSAYGVYSALKKDNLSKGPMAYKNVHARIQRLYEIGLIEQMAGDFSRNAIKYRVTTRGLFQILLTHTPSSGTLEMYKDNIILSTILYQFFEVETIRRFNTMPRGAALRSYVQKCCEKILQKLEEFRVLPHLHKEEYLETEIDDLIKSEVKNFLFQIISISKIRSANFGVLYLG